ncbi:RNA-binding protein squid-like [Toxorhynchites rutilus septentrionalis]|uniref:RNA-binding protein squid-like n=1 Tax=Toxorhynchites rutilus septentrionalis TaxID=329112 RepID=UPI0024786536|nr:RNA-binding protein squid-like [Toxorhynchites rutilus septentrionalis]
MADTTPQVNEAHQNGDKALETVQNNDQNSAEQTQEAVQQTTEQNGTEQSAENQEDTKQSEEAVTNGNSKRATLDNHDRKLFVGGISPETTEKELKEHFVQYGEIEDISLRTDRNTGRSRGFAFIVFKEADYLDAVIAAGDHIIKGKKIDAKKAKARQGKIFVGGLSPEISDETIKTFFGQFGTIAGIEVPFDKQKNQRKNFCFITFDAESEAAEALKVPKQTIAGKEVDVKKATQKPNDMQTGGRGGLRGKPQRGGRGGYSYGQRDFGQFGYGGFGAGGFDQGGYGQGGFGYNDFGYGGFGQTQGFGYGYSSFSNGGFQGKQRGGRGGQRQSNRQTPY